MSVASSSSTTAASVVSPGAEASPDSGSCLSFACRSGPEPARPSRRQGRERHSWSLGEPGLRRGRSEPQRERRRSSVRERRSCRPERPTPRELRSCRPERNLPEVRHSCRRGRHSSKQLTPPLPLPELRNWRRRELRSRRKELRRSLREQRRSLAKGLRSCPGQWRRCSCSS
jgi:hypothetical protein